MTSIVLVDKGGSLKQHKAKDASTETLYSKCGFRKKEGFDKRTTWNVKIDQENYDIELWSREHGKAGSENKYDFPPPVDTTLYFGTCCLVRKDGDTIVNLTTEEWKKIYEKLFGGFHDIDVDEEESEDELENVPKELKTNSGYLKDGFVVNTDSDSEGNEVNDNIDDLIHECENEVNDSVNEEDSEEDSDEENDGSEIELEIYNYSSDEE